jgi:TRAP-type C4-dicarboxylate transport system substrate-binding protein
MNWKGTLALVGFGSAFAAAVSFAQAKELLYGFFGPLTHPVLDSAAKPLFERLEKETNGALKWKIVPNGQILTATGHVSGLRDGIADGTYLITPYARTDLPNLNYIFDLFQFGEDTMAVGAATAETVLLNCPECIQELKRSNLIWLIGIGLTPAKLICSKDYMTLDKIKGKKIKGTGGVEARWIEAMGAVHLNMTMPDAVVAIERGTIDCFLGPTAFIKSYGVWDPVKHVSNSNMGIFRTMATLVMNRKSWDALTATERTAILKLAPEMTARGTINGYMGYDATVEKEARERGIKFHDGAELDALRRTHAEKDKATLIQDAKGRGVKDPAGLMDRHAKDLDKWHRIVKETGADIDKMTKALWTEVYSKVDPGKI